MKEMILTIKSNPQNLAQVEKYLHGIKQELKIKEEKFANILISTTEAVNNAIIHGNKIDESKSVNINTTLDNNDLHISISDEGKGFDYKKIPDPRHPDRISMCGGRGVMIMSELCDHITYKNNGSTVNLEFLKVV